MGAVRAGLLLGVYTASWAYAEALIFREASGRLGLDPSLAAGLLGVAGIAAGGLGLLALSRGPRRLAPLLAPLPALAYAATMLGGGWLSLALAYPLMALAVAVVGSAVMGYLLDTSWPESWPRLVASFRVSQTLSRGVVLGALLALRVAEAPALAALAGIPLAYAAVAAPVLVSMRRVERLTRLIDRISSAVVTMNSRRDGIPLSLYLASALAGVGIAAGARFQLTPYLSGVSHEERLAVLAAYSILYALGSAVAAAAPSLTAVLAVGPAAWLVHAKLEPEAAFSVVGGLLGYAETSLALSILTQEPTAAARYTGIALLLAAGGILAYSINPTVAMATAAALALAAAAHAATARSQPRWY